MPFKCCMPACKSNYDKEKVSVFSFPKDPQLLSKWVKAVCRQDFVVTKHSKVCELHFRKCDIERSVAMFDSKAGKTITAPLSYPRLSTGAIPCILPGCPKCLSATSSSATSTREDPAAKRLRLEHENVEQAIADSVRTQEEYQNTVSFKDFPELLVKIDKCDLNNNWIVIRNDNFISVLLGIKNSTSPKVQCYNR